MLPDDKGARIKAAAGGSLAHPTGDGGGGDGPVDDRTFRQALGRFATGVTVITARAGHGRPVGVTVNAFASLSLRPPLVLFCLDKGTTDLEAYGKGSAIVINVLAEGQRALSELFASQRTDKFQVADHHLSEAGCPRLEGCIATLECRVTASHDGGDHVVLIAHVDAIGPLSGDPPLLYFRSRYARLGPVL